MSFLSIKNEHGLLTVYNIVCNNIQQNILQKIGF